MKIEIRKIENTRLTRVICDLAGVCPPLPEC
jgi:hypothetical protein